MSTLAGGTVTPRIPIRAAVAFALTMLGACTGRDDDVRLAAQLTGGLPSRGELAIRLYGCGSCHIIPGVPGAHARVGPPLWGIADQAYIAGVLPNTEPNMIRWLQDPGAVDPRTVMPNMGVTERDARDIAAYLLRLRAEPATLRMVRGFIERAWGRQVHPGGAVSEGSD